MKKTLTIALIMLISLPNLLFSQLETRKIYFPEIEWSILIPLHSNYMDSLQIERLYGDFIKSAEESIGLDFDEAGQKTLFLTRNGMYNFFGATISVYDSSEYSSHDRFLEETFDALIFMIKSQEPSIVMLDTLSSQVNIDGLQFKKFNFKTQYPDYNLELQNCWYYRIYKDYFFSINIAYKDEAVGLQYIDLINTSEFDKK